jgi:hypothetical protein
MCNLYSMTTNVEAIRRLFAVDPANDRAGNLASMPGIYPDYPAPIVHRARHIPDLSERADRYSILASASGDGPRAEILNASPGAVGPASRLTASLC